MKGYIEGGVYGGGLEPCWHAGVARVFGSMAWVGGPTLFSVAQQPLAFQICMAMLGGSASGEAGTPRSTHEQGSLWRVTEPATLSSMGLGGRPSTAVCAGAQCPVATWLPC